MQGHTVQYFWDSLHECVHLQSLVTAITCNKVFFFVFFSPHDWRWHGLSRVYKLLYCHLKISSKFDHVLWHVQKAKAAEHKDFEPMLRVLMPTCSFGGRSCIPSICCMFLFSCWTSLLSSPESDFFNPCHWKSFPMNNTKLFTVGIQSYTRLTGAFSFF